MSEILKENLNGIQHLGLPTGKFDETIAFFEKLGFVIAYQTVNDGNRVAFLKLNTLVIETYEDAAPANAYGAIEHVAIDVADIEAVYKEICAMDLNTLNDEIHFLPFWDNGVRYFTIEGPNKEKVEFSQML